MKVRRRAKNITLDRKIGMLIGATWRDEGEQFEFALAQVSMATMLHMRSEEKGTPLGASGQPLYIAWDGEDKILLHPATANGGNLRITAYGALMEL